MEDTANQDKWDEFVKGMQNLTPEEIKLFGGDTKQGVAPEMKLFDGDTKQGNENLTPEEIKERMFLPPPEMKLFGGDTKQGKGYIKQYGREQGKTKAHIMQTQEDLKRNKKVCVVTGAIKAYCDLFKLITGNQLFYKELKKSRFQVSLTPI